MVTDFAITPEQEVAGRTITQVDLLAMSLADQQAVADAFCNPPAAAVAPALKCAFARRHTLLRTE